MSHISILTGGSDIHEPLVMSLKSKVGLSEVRLITNNTTKSELDNLSCDEPFFNDKFLVEVITDRMDLKKLRLYLLNLTKLTNCDFIFVNKNKEVHTLCLDVFSSLGIKELNNYIPHISILELYIKTYCTKRYTVRAVDNLHSLMNGQWNLLSTYLLMLEGLNVETIDTEQIISIVPKAVHLNVNDFLISLITKNNLKKNIKILFNYKFANKYIMTSLQERIDLYINMKKDYIGGFLRLDNIHEYSKSKKISAYVVEKVYNEILTKYDTEMLYYYKYIINKYEKDYDGFLMVILEVMKI